MTNFVFAYHGGSKPESPEAGAKHMAEWNAWVDGLGAAAVEPGNPLGNSKTVSTDGVTDGGGAAAMSGYSVIKADGMDAALEMAKQCPFLGTGGTIVVSEMMKMP